MSTSISAGDARACLIRRSDMVACRTAFIDCRMPGSECKENYSLNGPGVTQSHDQVVNITEPHGFSLGVAAMLPGTVNNLHVHFTAKSSSSIAANGVSAGVRTAPGRDRRSLAASGDTAMEVALITAGDQPRRIAWAPEIVAAALRSGAGIDHDGHVARLDPLPPGTRDAVAARMHEGAVAA